MLCYHRLWWCHYNRQFSSQYNAIVTNSKRCSSIYKIYKWPLITTTFTTYLLDPSTTYHCMIPTYHCMIPTYQGMLPTYHRMLPTYHRLLQPTWTFCYLPITNYYLPTRTFYYRHITTYLLAPFTTTATTYPNILLVILSKFFVAISLGRYLVTKCSSCERFHSRPLLIGTNLCSLKIEDGFLNCSQPNPTAPFSLLWTWIINEETDRRAKHHLRSYSA